MQGSDESVRFDSGRGDTAGSAGVVSMTPTATATKGASAETETGRVRAAGARAAPARRWLSSVLVALSVLGVAPRATASARDEASQHFARGMELVEKGNVKDALDEFLRAYSLVPHYAVLYNIGHAYSDLGQPLQALDAFRRYLDEGGTRIEPNRRASVERALQQLEASMGRIQVLSAADGTSIELDGVSVGRTPLQEPMRVNPGMHRVSPLIPGQVAAAESVNVAPGQTVIVTLAPPPKSETRQVRQLGGEGPQPVRSGGLSEHGVATLPSDRAGPFDSWREYQRPMAVGVGVVGLAGIGMGAGYGLRSLSRETQSDELCAAGDGDPVSCSDTPGGRRGLRLNQDALDDTTSAWTICAIGGALLAGGVALWLTAPSAPAQRRKPLTATLAVDGRLTAIVVRGVLP